MKWYSGSAQSWWSHLSGTFLHNFPVNKSWTVATYCSHRPSATVCFALLNQSHSWSAWWTVCSTDFCGLSAYARSSGWFSTGSQWIQWVPIDFWMNSIKNSWLVSSFSPSVFFFFLTLSLSLSLSEGDVEALLLNCSWTFWGEELHLGCQILLCSYSYSGSGFVTPQSCGHSPRVTVMKRVRAADSMKHLWGRRWALFEWAKPLPLHCSTQ